jgi:hypothetical protein
VATCFLRGTASIKVALEDLNHDFIHRFPIFCFLLSLQAGVDGDGGKAVKEMSI